MVYMGGSSESRRSKVALAKRAVNAARRGWTWERRQSTKAESGIRDGGEHRKGKQKGRGMHAHGDGEPSDGKGKGGKWGRSRWREVESSAPMVHPRWRGIGREGSETVAEVVLKDMLIHVYVLHIYQGGSDIYGQAHGCHLGIFDFQFI